MICIKTDIPDELNKIDDELKAIFKSRDLRNSFVERTKGMKKLEREEIYREYLK